MASLLHLGADLHAVRQAVESVGCRLEVSCQKGAALQPVDGSCPRCLLLKAPDYGIHRSGNTLQNPGQHPF